MALGPGSFYSGGLILLVASGVFWSALGSGGFVGGFLALVTKVSSASVI